MAVRPSQTIFQNSSTFGAPGNRHAIPTIAIFDNVIVLLLLVNNVVNCPLTNESVTNNYSAFTTFDLTPLNA